MEFFFNRQDRRGLVSDHQSGTGHRSIAISLGSNPVSNLLRLLPGTTVCANMSTVADTMKQAHSIMAVLDM